MAIAAFVTTFWHPISLAAITIVLVIGLIVRWRLSYRTPPGTRPLPGPWGLPYIGRIHDVDPKMPWFKLKDFADEYGPIFQTRIMGHEHVWVADPEISHDLMAKRPNIYSDKHEIPIMPGVKEYPRYLPLLGYNETHRLHRKFAVTVLTEAHNAKYYGYPVLEAKRLIAKLTQDPDDYSTLIDRFTGRITCRLAWGDPDRAIQIRENAALFLWDISPAGPVANALEFPLHLPEWMVPSKVNERRRQDREGKMFMAELQKVRKQMVEGQCPGPSYARSYLEKEKQWGFRDDWEAAFAIGMGSNVGIHTISSPLNTFLLAMVLHPEWQAACRKEVDEVLGEDRFIDPSDSPRLPMLRACILEAFRWRPPVPPGVPHPAMKDDVYNGYHIPKGAYVHSFEWAISRDPTRYPDPETYKPSRWLSADYPSYRAPLTEHPTIIGHHQFGFGRRQCLGQHLGQVELLIACGAIIWAFELRKQRDSNGQEVFVPDWDFSILPFAKPNPFHFDMKVRGEDRRRKVMEWWRESEDGVEDMQM